MPQQARKVWNRQTKKQQAQILKELTIICQGIINEHLRINNTVSSSTEGNYLHQTINPSSNTHKPGKFKIAVRA